MRKLYIFGLIALASLIIGLAWAEQITLTTYYPAPYGVYNDMRVMDRLGIGTMDPGSYSLAIKSGGNNHYLGMGEDLAGGSDGFNFQIAPWGGTPTTRLGYLEGNFGGSLGFYIRNRRNAPLLLGTNDQERVRITGNGNVGIGTASPGGKLDVDGSIYQRGGVLHADYVFEPDYELESIEEHADYMWQNKHLNSVPEAKIDENGQQILEIGAHRRGILEELEKAHIYIAQLKEILDKQEKRIASLEDNHKPTE